ncbi:MAG: ribonuclease P protein component [Gammaproteobacteria bacterium]|nr:ribonuclease P protein component [Gammaproteobacteria bacterium]MBU1440534.1 ribonuclease P protein component [Gammaproteobacteria bacterium]
MQRLTTRAQFQAVLAGTIVARTPHFALHRRGFEQMSTAEHLRWVEGEVWMGALVPKRWAKRAVTRNAIRRQIYVLGSASERELPRAAHVVRLRSAFDRKEFVSATSEKLKSALRAELQLLLQRSMAA